MKQIMLLGILAGVFLLSASGCVYAHRDYAGAGGYVEVEMAPPPPPREVIVEAPSPRHVWQPGYWTWRGRWVWQEGHWVTRPHPGAIWVEGRWERRGPHYVWRPGYWR